MFAQNSATIKTPSYKGQSLSGQPPLGSLNLGIDFATAPLNAIKARDAKIAADKEKAHQKAVKAAKEKIRLAKVAAEKQRAAVAAQVAHVRSMQSSVTPVYQAPAPTTTVANCGDNSFANFIYMHESGCKLVNPNGSGCDGIGQACPSSKIYSACPNMDYACQNAWFTNYASKYGGWAGAYAFWLANHWW